MTNHTPRTASTGVRLREAGQPRGLAERAGILLHGRSRTKQEMLDLATGLEIGGTRWIAPYADNGLWYPGRFMEPLASNEPFLTRSVERCHRLVQDASEDGRLDPSRIFIVGFSQGACLATEFVARNTARYGGLVAFTGGLIGPPGTRFAYSGELSGTACFLGAGDRDPHVPWKRVEESASVLSGLGGVVTLRSYPGLPHTINEDEIEQAKSILSRLVATGRAV